MTDSDWSIPALKEYVDVQIEAVRGSAEAKAVADQQRFDAQGKAIDAASTVVDRALVEARVGVAEQFRVLGEKVDRLGDTVGVPRPEMEALVTGVVAKTETKIADAIAQVVSRFSSDIDRLTKAIEKQNEQWGVEFNTLNTAVADISQRELTRKGTTTGVALTGRTVATGLAALVAVIAIVSAMLRFVPK